MQYLPQFRLRDFVLLGSVLNSNLRFLLEVLPLLQRFLFPFLLKLTAPLCGYFGLFSEANTLLILLNLLCDFPLLLRFC